MPHFILQRVRHLLSFLLLVYVGQPFAGRGSLTFSDVKESLLNLGCDFTAFPGANLNPIDGPDWRDFGCGAAEEEFVSDVQGRALMLRSFTLIPSSLQI